MSDDATGRADWLQKALADAVAANATATALVALAARPDFMSPDAFERMLATCTRSVQHRFGPWGRLSLEAFRGALAKNLAQAGGVSPLVQTHAVGPQDIGRERDAPLPA